MKSQTEKNLRRLKAGIRLALRTLRKSDAIIEDDGYFSDGSREGYYFVPKRKR